MTTLVFHMLEYITVKTSFFIIENTVSLGYYIGSSAASYVYSSLIKNNNKLVKNATKTTIDENNISVEYIEEMKKELSQLKSKVDELEKKVKEE